MKQNKMQEAIAVLGQAIMEQLIPMGLDFKEGSEALSFVNDELRQPLNTSLYFVQPCHFYKNKLRLNECVDAEKVNVLSGEVMGKFMRNRLIIILPILYIIAAISIVSNMLGIRAVVGVRHKSPRHWVLMNLSIADSLLAPLNALKVTSEVLAYEAFDVYFRTYFNSIWQVFFLLCPLSLFFLALDNLIAVVAPFFYERHSGSGARVLMLSVGAAAWFGIVLFIGLLHVFNVQHSQTVQLIVAIVLLFIIASTVSLYLVLAMKAEIYRRKLLGIALPSSVTNNHQQQREMLRSRMKTTATTLSIVLTLAGLWSPFTSYLLISESTKFANVPFFIKFLCVALTLFQLGTAVDPIVYCCRMAEVRRSLLATVVPTSCRERFNKHHQDNNNNNNNTNSYNFHSQLNAKKTLSATKKDNNNGFIQNSVSVIKSDNDEKANEDEKMPLRLQNDNANNA